MATKTINEITINKIKIGSKAPKAIYKGSTEVKAVYKGSTCVYKKEDVIYTLTGNNTTNTATQTQATFTVNSYKGSSTAVALTTSNVSVTSGSATIVSVASAGGTKYTITIQTGGNSSTSSSRTFKIKVTQPTSGQSIELTCTQSKKTAYLTLKSIGFCFSGNFPTRFFAARCTDLNIRGSYQINEKWNGQLYSSVTGGSMSGNSRDCYAYSDMSSSDHNYQVYSTYDHNQEALGTMVSNGDSISYYFLFGNTWSGSTAYDGNTWYMHTKEQASKKTYLPNKTTSMSWQTYVQPSGPIGFSSTFQNITADVNNFDLVIDLNWSWNSSWASYGL